MLRRRAPTIRYYDWRAEHRDPKRDGLVSILQPDESGLDASPKYDATLGLKHASEAGPGAAMGGHFHAYASVRGDQPAMIALHVFNVVEVLVNIVYAAGLLDLAELCREAGGAEAGRYGVAARRTMDALMRTCWDGARGAF